MLLTPEGVDRLVQLVQQQRHALVVGDDLQTYMCTFGGGGGGEATVWVVCVGGDSATSSWNKRWSVGNNGVVQCTALSQPPPSKNNKKSNMHNNNNSNQTHRT